MKDDRYPTRTGGTEKILPRLDPVVYDNANAPSQLSPDQVQFYEDNGYLILDGILSDYVSPLFAEIPKMKSLLRGKTELILEPETDVVRSIFSPDKFNELFKKTACHPVLLNSARQLLGSNVYMHHSRMNVKEGLTGKSFPWHSDFETWHSEDGIPNMRILTGWVFLTENNEFNGSLYVIPGSHKLFISCAGETPKDNYKSSLRNQIHGTPSKNTLSIMVEKYGMKGIYGKPGTVVFHEGNLLHGSPDNLSPIDRTNLFFVYNSIKNKPVPLAQGKSPRPEFLARHDHTILKTLSPSFRESHVEDK